MAAADLPRIALTVGDPAGIGPEIAVKAADDTRVHGVAEIVLYGPSTTSELAPFPAGQLSGTPDEPPMTPSCGPSRDAKTGHVDAIVTAPINKAAFAMAGLPWRGHTDLLAHLTDAPHVAMMFHSHVLRVVLATVHVPLAEVPRVLTGDRLEATIRLTAARTAAVWVRLTPVGARRAQPARRRRRPDG